MKRGIHVIITGGTLDSYYDVTKDTVVPSKASCLPEFLKGLKLHQGIKFTRACMKDSRNLMQRDLNAILRAVEKSPFNKIVITHGTYTMADTAKFLKIRLKSTDKTIVVTGSLVPLVGFTPSDAPFNLGYAIAKAQDLPPGIYVCMNGYVFSPEEVMKQIYAGRFVSLFGEGKKRV